MQRETDVIFGIETNSKLTLILIVFTCVLIIIKLLLFAKHQSFDDNNNTAHYVRDIRTVYLNIGIYNVVDSR